MGKRSRVVKYIPRQCGHEVVYLRLDGKRDRRYKRKFRLSPEYLGRVVANAIDGSIARQLDRSTAFLDGLERGAYG